MTADRDPEPLDVEAWGWASAIPAGLALAPAIAWGVPALARVLAGPPSPEQRPLARVAAEARPEPGEQALYLVCLVVPAVVAWALAALARRLPTPGRPVRLAALSVQVLLAAAAVATWAYQDRLVHRYFDPVRWALGLAVVLGGGWLVARARAGGARLRLPAPALLAAAAAGAHAAWRLGTAVFDDASILATPVNVGYHLPFTLDEFAAVLNGRTALVDYFPQYATVLPHLLAPAFRIVGLDVRTFTLGMSALSLAGLVLCWDTLRRATGSPWTALALHVPLVALAFFPTEVYRTMGPANSFNYYAHAPLRYLGPWVVGWLVAWQQSRPGPFRLLVLFVGAGLAAANNADFGVPALGGALLAALLTGPGTVLPRPAHVARVVAAAAAGVALAAGALAAGAWARTGELPHLGRMLLFQSAFARSGFNMLPMPPWGVHWIVYATFMVGLFAAMFRLAALRPRDEPAPDEAPGPDARLAPAVLVFASVFGAGALALYVGRSHWAVLVSIFPAWGLAAMLLCWVAVRPVLRPPRGSAGPARVVPRGLAIAAYALCVGEILPFPPRPATNVGFPPAIGAAKASWVVDAPALAAELRRMASPGGRLMLAIPAGHLVAELAGVENVYPFAEDESCLLQGQVDLVERTIRARGVSRYVGPMPPELAERLRGDPVPWRLEVIDVARPPVATGWPE